MPRLVDLSHPVGTGIQVFPGDPNVLLSPALTLDENGVAVTQVHCGSHTGTHVDAPSHTVAGGRNMSAIEVDELYGTATVFHISGLEPGHHILFTDLGEVTAQVDPLVIIATGWDQYFGSQLYLEHPVLSVQAAVELRARGMRVLAMDTLNPDKTLQPDDGDGFPVHAEVLGNDGLIVENLCGATALPPRCKVGFFPFKLEGTDGAPVRAVAWVPN